MEGHVAAMETARSALEASCYVNCNMCYRLFCSGQAELAAGKEGDQLLHPTQELVVAVSSYKTAAGSVKTLVPKPKSKAKAKAKGEAKSSWSSLCWPGNFGDLVQSSGA